MKAYTDLEQSKKLAEILPIESADMRYHTISQYNQYPCDEIVYTIDFGKPSGIDIPCWSLSALLGVISYPTLSQEYDGKWSCMEFPGDEEVEGCENPVDACVEMILELNEQKLL